MLISEYQNTHLFNFSLFWWLHSTTSQFDTQCDCVLHLFTWDVLLCPLVTMVMFAELSCVSATFVLLFCRLDNGRDSSSQVSSVSDMSLVTWRSPWPVISCGIAGVVPCCCGLTNDGLASFALEKSDSSSLSDQVLSSPRDIADTLDRADAGGPLAKVLDEEAVTGWGAENNT